MTKPRLLITGARGFVGAQILASLGDVYDLHAVSRSLGQGNGLTWHNADLRDPAACIALIRDVRPSHLIHSAWETSHGAFWEADSNLAWAEAGKALFSEFVAIGGQRIVGCGTCAEYAGSSDPLREGDDHARPTTRYGRAKLDLFQALQDMPVSSAWARIFYPYGAGENAARFVPSVCRSLLQGAQAKCSSGVQLRNFMDVRDLGAAIGQLAQHRLTGPINIGHTASHKIGDVAMMIGGIAGRADLVSLGSLPDRQGEPAVLVPDLHRQTNELKFNPRIGIHEGLNDAYRWWQGQMDAKAVIETSSS